MALNLNINDYTYDLPNDRIARYPLAKRDEAKLLVYSKGKISHERFTTLPELIPSNALLYFNNTKVIPARMVFQKDTGAEIEIFLLTPIDPSPVMASAMQAQKQCTWKCTIGNLKRWSNGAILKKVSGTLMVEASLLNREEGLIEFSWNDDTTFAEVVDQSGKTPLPPYLKRDAEHSDKERYQTIYSKNEGAVAAPTAGLHFTEDIFDALTKKGITKDFITLHVSAGTFQPVKVDNALAHVMHTEQIIVTRTNIENLLIENRMIIPVGTTSMRTLESIYWFGMKLLTTGNTTFSVSQTDPYQAYKQLPGKKESLQAILDFMVDTNLESLTGHSSIYIHPGYTFKICDALITNFHQPGSTLILLVAAFIGENWKQVYKEALENDYRFLSYGDSSLIIP